MGEKILNDFNEHFQNKYDVYKIYEKDGEAMVFANTHIAFDDGIFWYKSKDYIRAVTPFACMKAYDKIVKDENLVYIDEEINKKMTE